MIKVIKTYSDKDWAIFASSSAPSNTFAKQLMCRKKFCVHSRKKRHICFIFLSLTAFLQLGTFEFGPLLWGGGWANKPKWFFSPFFSHRKEEKKKMQINSASYLFHAFPETLPLQEELQYSFLHTDIFCIYLHSKKFFF